MLDTDTKRRIDTARDILVGKVPDPKSQVEQITIALIYKFMDDMDSESEELGGKRKFFDGDFYRYGWAKLMRSGLGGHETLNLYAEAITKMPENPGIPPLFRDIFKNAYLPYRDPETLRAFLKIIDEFEYDHSERLGDAFEYLLSVLGSQGDAGQFRTPRHIIDFMVKVVDPKKNETVLDPACGTAGFLISSYKHIRQANIDEKGNSTLTPDEKGRLAKNFKGYDISPDMVRLSLVNMYLHGFVSPEIYEYDTLTSMERWNDYADVILANPPFMSPKGGIRPHNRFSVKSKRSEVLFVDYMSEHLSSTGRAGIIVPEGIIFQSQKAYKQLRKMLVEESLVAVVSLPAGVFNPYSGVKTSILILDKSLARKAKYIGFFKVNNDGFNLGAQRRQIDKNDLPPVQAELAEYMNKLRAGESVEELQPAHGLVVEKEKIAANGEFNLSGRRHRKHRVNISSFPLSSLGDVAEVIPGQSPPGESYNELGNGMSFYQGKTKFGDIYLGPPSKWTTDPKRLAKAGDILISVRAPVGPVNITSQPICIGRGLASIRPKKDRLLSFFCFYLLRGLEGEITGNTGAVFASINKQDIQQIQIPLPPLEVQKEIVEEIEGYQRVIDGARAVVDNYKPHIPIDPEWPMVELGNVCETITDGDHQAPPKASEGVPFITIRNINDDHELDFTKTFFVPETYYEKLKVSRKPQGGDILYTVTGSYGIPVIVSPSIKFCFQRHIALIRTGTQLLNRFLLSLLESPFMLQQGHEAATGAAQKTVSLTSLRGFHIPLPPLAIQEAIVAEIEVEQAIVNSNKDLISRFEEKIQRTLARVWGEGE